MMTPEQLDEFDKRKLAIHEAGHVAVLAACGRYARAWLWRADAADPVEEKTWRGRTQCFDGMSAVASVAGLAAECLDDDPAVEAWDILDWWDGDVVSPSPTDLLGIPDEWPARESALSEALDILRRERALFDRITAILIQDESITDGEVKELANELLTRCG